MMERTVCNTSDDLLNELEKIHDEARRLAFEETGWKNYSNKKGVVLQWVRSSWWNGIAWRIDYEVNGSVDRIFDILHPLTAYYKPKWDPLINEGDCLQELNDSSILLRFRFKPMFMGFLGARESINVCHLDDGDQQKSMTFGSVIHPAFAELTPGFIRAWAYPTGVFITPTRSSNAAKVTMVFQADLNIPLAPNWLLETGIPSILGEYAKALKCTGDIKWTPLKDVPGLRNRK